MNITDAFIEILHGFSSRPINENIMEKAKLCVLDYLGCTYVGATMQKEQTNALLGKLSSEGSAVLLGMNKKADAMTAALVNGLNAHKAELDDGHRFAMLHPGVPVISALLAAAPVFKFDGDAFLRGLIAGYEAAVRLGRAIQPSHKMRGGHASGSCGVIGAAAAISIAAGFDKTGLKNAVSAAATCASALLEMMDDSSEMKPYNVGQAALNGYVSAVMGSSGFAGPCDPIGGKRGFLRVMADSYDTSFITGNNNDGKLCIEQIYVKSYAACRHCHPAIEAALSLVSRHNISAGEIENIEIETYKLAISGHDHTAIGSTGAAKMSTPFSIATAIVNGRAGLSEFDGAAISREDIFLLAQKVTLNENPELTDLSPGKRAAIVRICLSDGQAFEHRVDDTLGEPENPMTAVDMEEKFAGLAGHAGLPEQTVSRAIAATRSMDKDFETWINSI